MIARLLLITAVGILLSGCFIAPIAMVGPAVSGFSTASLVQAGVSTGANYVIKQSTGKTISEHAITAINEDILKQTFSPIKNVSVKEIQ
tara:strand:+ start:2348 stop:2614 length:267 start_codon:yes stop_codon:yes gene_type:complete